MAGLELKVPPPLVALGCALVMKGIALLVAGDDARGDWPVLRFVAVALVLAGLTIDVVGVWSFRRARTTVNPLKPANSSALVTSGIYGLTRNPMYLGMAMLLAGWAAWLGTTWALAGVAAFIAWITRFQIVPEERALARLFGTEYDAYRARVSRWI
ncbi:MAG: isoprenylcysteine carboxylmethyltransferase family protein [Steroidobacteraceae bacterium]|jgi:protein-S-isoprenylcysteine O-methyltransferase Ste14|nr:isoprenylcysteine carboxylmethyltransferase family protein [Steroidobacteraceae bacterium]